MDLEALINHHYRELSENDLQIMSYIIENKNECLTIPIVELANRTHTSKSSIVRLAKKLGFSGFSEFKYSLKNDSKQTQRGLAQISFSLMQNEDSQVTLKLFNQIDLVPILKEIYSAKRIFCYGTGWGQKNVLSDFIRNFVPLDKFLTLIPAQRELEMVVDSTFSKGDLFIVLSLSGDINDVKDEMNVLKLKGIPILSITSLRNNYLASMATYNLYFQATPVILKGENIYSFLTLFQVTDSLFRAYLDFYQKNEIERKEF